MTAFVGVLARSRERGRLGGLAVVGVVVLEWLGRG